MAVCSYSTPLGFCRGEFSSLHHVLPEPWPRLASFLCTLLTMATVAQGGPLTLSLGSRPGRHEGRPRSAISVFYLDPTLPSYPSGTVPCGHGARCSGAPYRFISGREMEMQKRGFGPHIPDSFPLLSCLSPSYSHLQPQG